MPKSLTDKLIAALREVGATPEVLLVAMQFMVAQEKRDKNAAKVARWRYKQVTNGLQEGHKVVTATEGEKVTLRAGERAGSISTSSSLQSEEGTTPLPPTTKTPVTDTRHEIEFEQVFWPAYPRQVGKAKALEAFVKVRKSGMDLAVLVAGANRYAASMRVQQKSPEYIAHAATWLNQARWNDPAETTVRAVPAVRQWLI